MSQPSSAPSINIPQSMNNLSISSPPSPTPNPTLSSMSSSQPSYSLNSTNSFREDPSQHFHQISTVQTDLQSLPTNERSTSPINEHENNSQSDTGYVPNVENLREIFVGNLSFFCTEQDLIEFFGSYANVESARIVRNDDRSKSLMFGFVTFSTVQEANEMTHLFNQHMFKGRHMRVHNSETRHLNSKIIPDYQVHVAFSSDFPPSMDAVIPTECFLRKYFVRFGRIVDVKVRDYTQHMGGKRQTGYAFLAFQEDVSAFEAVNACTRVVVDAITIVCTFSHQSQKGVGSNYGSLAQRHQQGQSSNANSSGHHQARTAHGGRSRTTSNASTAASLHKHQGHNNRSRARDGVVPCTVVSNKHSTTTSMYAHHNPPVSVGHTSPNPVTNMTMTIPPQHAPAIGFYSTGAIPMVLANPLPPHHQSMTMIPVAGVATGHTSAPHQSHPSQPVQHITYQSQQVPTYHQPNQQQSQRSHVTNYGSYSRPY